MQELLAAQQLIITVTASRTEQPSARPPAARPARPALPPLGGGGGAFAGLAALTERGPGDKAVNSPRGSPPLQGWVGGQTS